MPWQICGNQPHAVLETSTYTHSLICVITQWGAILANRTLNSYISLRLILVHSWEPTPRKIRLISQSLSTDWCSPISINKAPFVCNHLCAHLPHTQGFSCYSTHSSFYWHIFSQHWTEDRGEVKEHDWQNNSATIQACEWGPVSSILFR